MFFKTLNKIKFEKKSNKMNSTLENNEYDSFCFKLFAIYSNYMELSIGIIGTILNFICTFIFYKLIRNSNQKDNLNKYLLVKSIADTYISIDVMVIRSINLFKSDKSFVYQIFNLIFLRYIVLAFELISMFLEIASILNRYFTLTRVNKKFENIGFKTKVCIMVVYSFGFYTYRFFDEQIESYTDVNSNQTFYKLTINKLDSISIILGYIHSTVRDGICVLLIFILNILTLIKLRKMLKNKKHFQFTNASKEKQEQFELRLTKMIIGTTSITFFGHILTFIEYITVNVINSNNCFSTFSSFTFFACNSFNFVLYYFFNLNFKRVFLSIISYKNMFKS